MRAASITRQTSHQLRRTADSTSDGGITWGDAGELIAGFSKSVNGRARSKGSMARLDKNPMPHAKCIVANAKGKPRIERQLCLRTASSEASKFATTYAPIMPAS